MRRIALVLALCVSAFAETEDDKITLDPFNDSTTNETYKAPDWPNLDFPFLQAGVAAHWVQHGRWPVTIAEVKDGAKLWITSLAIEAKEKVDGDKFVDRFDVFEIVEVIPMWRGVAYRLVYKKGSRSIPGMVVFDEADSVEDIMKNTRFSQDFGGITNAVPF